MKRSMKKVSEIPTAPSGELSRGQAKKGDDGNFFPPAGAITVQATQS